MATFTNYGAHLRGLQMIAYCRAGLRLCANIGHGQAVSHLPKVAFRPPLRAAALAPTASL